MLLPLALLIVSVGEAQVEEVGPERFGGRTRALVAIGGVQGTPLTLLAGSVGGGLFRSTDEGKTWQAVVGFEGQAVTSLVVNPNDPDEIYAGTGESNQRIPGFGIRRSQDGGATWTPVPGSDRPELRFIKRISLSANGDEMLVATTDGLFGSATSNFDFRCALPILGGCAEPMSDVVFHPTDPDKAVAASADSAGVFYGERDPVTGDLLWHVSAAETPDTATWQRWSGDVALAYAKARSEVVYASVNGYEFYPPLWRSEDGGKVFKPADGSVRPCVSHLKQGLDDKAGWANFVWAGHGAEEEFLVLGRVDLWRSTDGGTSLTTLSDFDKHPQSVHADPHVLAVRSNFGAAGGSTDAWVGTDGGVFYTRDLTAAGRPCEPVAWQERNKGFSAAQIYSATALADGTILAGTQDLGLLRRKPVTGCAPGSGSGCWSSGRIDKKASSTPVRDDVFTVLPHPTIASASFALGNDFFVLRTTDAGGLWQYISKSRWNETGWVSVGADLWPVEAITADHLKPALAVDSQQPPALYLAGGCLYRTRNPMAPVDRDSGPEWRWVQAPLRKPFCEKGPYIVSVAPTPGAPDDLWLCYHDGRVFRTENAYGGEPLWHPVRSEADERQERPCKSLLVTDAGTAWVAYGDFDREPLVYRIDDLRTAGKSYAWTAYPLPDGAHPYQLAAHPQDSQRIFVATELGVFERLSTGAWQPVAGLPALRTESLFWHDDDLYAATYGAGIFSVTP